MLVFGIRLVCLFVVFYSQLSFSLLDINGKGKKQEVVALYLFNEKGGNVVKDRSGFAEPLNLIISNTKNISWTKSSLKINNNVNGRGFNRTRASTWNNFDINKDAVFITSENPATKIYSRCSAKKEITFQTYFRSKNPVQESNIFSLEFPAGFYDRYRSELPNYKTLTGPVKQWTPTFIPYRVWQSYPGGVPKIRFRYRTEKESRTVALGEDLDTDLLKYDPKMSDPNKIHEVVFTHSANGRVEVYLDRFLVHSYLPTAADQASNKFDTDFFSSEYDTTFAGGKSRQLRVALGNKAFPGEITQEDIDQVVEQFNTFQSLPVDRDGDGVNDNDFPKYQLDTTNQASVKKYIERQLTHGFVGEFFMAAIYCKYFPPKEVMGTSEPFITGVTSEPVRNVNLDDPFLKSAKILLERVTGTKQSFYSEDVHNVADLLAQDQEDQAIELALENKEFLNTTIKNMAQKMSNRSETIDEPLNDFSASFIGVVRDETDARELLTGNFTYVADPKKVSVPSDSARDLLLSNRHYEALENQIFDLSSSLVRVDRLNPLNDPVGEVLLGQSIASGEKNKVYPLQESAGVLTSRAFMEEHASAGTNRRLVEYAFRQFLCIPIEEWADSSTSDSRVGGDITRFPSGDHKKYQTSCKSCHTVMDGFRGAFAYFDFSDGRMKHSRINPIDALGIDPWTINADSKGVVTKINWNHSIYPSGYRTTDNSFLNQASRGVNEQLFGWKTSSLDRGPASTGANIQETAYGATALGEMIANSKRFPECMAKRSFEALCQKQVARSEMASKLELHAQAFSNSNYNFKSLFKSIAKDPSCWKEN